MANVFKIYSRSWFYLRWHNLIYALPVFYFLKTVLFVYLGSSHSSLLTLMAFVLNFALGMVLELFLIIFIFNYKEILEINDSIWELMSTYFLRVCGISVASVFWVLLLISPFCFLVYLAVLAELRDFLIFLVPVAYFGFCVLSFGICDLGIRIVICEDKKIKESMWSGFRELNNHLSHYLPFVLASALLAALPIGLTTIFTLPQVPSGSSLDEFLTVMNQSGCATLTFLSYIIVPLNIAAKTFIYLDRKSHNIISLPQADGLRA